MHAWYSVSVAALFRLKYVSAVGVNCAGSRLTVFNHILKIGLSVIQDVSLQFAFWNEVFAAASLDGRRISSLSVIVWFTGRGQDMGIAILVQFWQELLEEGNRKDTVLSLLNGRRFLTKSMSCPRRVITLSFRGIEEVPVSNKVPQKLKVIIRQGGNFWQGGTSLQVFYVQGGLDPMRT